MPYAFGDFPKSFDGREGIYQQYSTLPNLFSRMSFPRTIYATENPDVLFVQFRGDIEIRDGGRYQNDYIGIFQFENGLIKEYTEYFNPILVSQAFNVPIPTD
jgi:ketosteroid isomerase-like protein